MKIESDVIRELAELLNETGLTEIEVAEGDQVVRVSKGMAVLTGASAATPQNSTMSSGISIPTQADAETTQSETAAVHHPGALKSPMVGTVYMQSEPGSSPFVAKGDQVSIGDTLLIIEAMKVMNPIKAEKSGTVTQILVSNGEPVEYDDVLMVIE